MSQKKHRCLLNNRAKAFCLVFIRVSVLNKAYPNLDFETRTVQIRYCLTKISIRAKRSISRVFSLFIVPSPFLYIARTNGLLTGCEGHTEKYRTAVFVQLELARAVLKDQGPVFLSMARETRLINRLLYDWTE